MKRRAALALLRIVSRVVPGRDRQAWLAEWEAELAHQRKVRMRPILGSFFDAAWLRRQFTRDAESLQDLRHGFRMLRRNPGFALTAVLTLGLGIGATVGITAVIDTLLLRALPYDAADRIVLVWQATTTDPDVRDDVAPGNCLDWRERARSFEHFACADPISFDYEEGPEPVTLRAASVTEGFFAALGTRMLLGRGFAPDEHLAGRDRVVVVAHGFWQGALGGDAAVVGRRIMLDRQPYEVVGVLPPMFQPRLLRSSREYPVYSPKVASEFERNSRGAGYWNAVGRLKPDIGLEEAQAELDIVSRHLASTLPVSNATTIARAQPLRDHLAGNLGVMLRLFAGAVGLLLLIAAANVANLLLSRMSERSREISVRAAIGAGRARLARQLLAESVLLAGLGGVAGLGIAWLTIRMIVVLAPRDIPALSSAAVDARTVVAAAIVTGLVAIAVGLAPAWHGTRGRLTSLLRGVAGGANRHGVAAAIVVLEVGTALVLMTGAGLLGRSFANLLMVDPGFTADRVVALQVFAWDRQTTPEKRTAFFHAVLSRMDADSRLTAAGAVSAMPFLESNINIETRAFADDRTQGNGATAFFTVATPGYFETMDIAVREGRAFDARDTADGARVAMVSETLARRLWPGRSAVGRRISAPRFQGRPVEAEVVGVAADIRHDGLDRPPRPEIFLPHAQNGFGSMTFVARTAGETATALAAMKEHIRTIEPAQTFYDAAAATELVSRSLVERRFLLALIGAFAVLAGVLAAIGTYGVMSVATAQRTREFGVRLALGASRREILTMVLRQGAQVAGPGLALGVVASLLAGGVLSRFLFGVEPRDPATLALTVVTLGAAAGIACVLPALRATRVSPLTTLQND